MLRVCAAVALLSSAAAADPIFQVGVGVRHHLNEPTMSEQPQSVDDTTFGFDASVAFPVTSTMAIGMRAAFSTARTSRDRWWGMFFYDEYRYRETPIDGGVVVMKRVGRVSFAPWIGVHSRRGTVDVRGCGPYGPMFPNKGDCSSPYQSQSRETEWSPIRPMLGGSVTVDIVRVSGAMLGAAIHAQYVTDFSSAGIDLTVRL